jgi:hypothetical protein
MRLNDLINQWRYLAKNPNPPTFHDLLCLAESIQEELERMSPVKDNTGTAEQWHHGDAAWDKKHQADAAKA